jgi:tumor protein p53-inducible protein 3
VRGARVLATAGSEEKLQMALQLGAECAVNYKSADYAQMVQESTQGRGADVIVDFVGAAYWERNASCLAIAGRCVMVGVLGGARAEVDLNQLIFKRQQILGLVMRSRPLSDKIAMTRSFVRESLPLFSTGHLKAVVDRVYRLTEAHEAHRRMERHENVGKIVLRVR